MTTSFYRKLEVVGTSSVGIEDAVSTAVAHAVAAGQAVDWFEVVETRGSVRDGKVSQYQVVVKLGCRESA